MAPPGNLILVLKGTALAKWYGIPEKEVECNNGKYIDLQQMQQMVFEYMSVLHRSGISRFANSAVMNFVRL